MKKTLLVLGNDKISGKALKKINNSNKNIKIVIDRSTSLKRVYKLINLKILSLSLVIKMFFSELFRKSKKPNKKLCGISSNLDLLNFIKDFNPDRLILFRAGLIINKNVLKTGIPILNIHAAKVPEFGGLGSIDKALKSGAYNQSACLHIVTSKIDEGEVIDSEDYQLNPKKNYYINEEIAYNASTNLLLRAIEKNYF